MSLYIYLSPAQINEPHLFLFQESNVYLFNGRKGTLTIHTDIEYQIITIWKEILL